MPFIQRQTKAKVSSIFGYYAFLAFFVYLGDAVMSYATPVFLDSKISDPFIAGVIFATSSMVGLLFNFIAGELLGSKSSNFFVRATVFIAIAFPASFLLAPNFVPAYLVGMAAWGIYFETQAFASFKFIELTKKRDEYSEAWSFIATIISISYFIGPLIATFLIDRFLELNFYVAIGCYLVAYFIFGLMKTNTGIKEKVEIKTKPVTPKVELKRWFVYMKKLWPLWTFGFMMYLIESFFWTIGIVYAESLKSESALAGYIISIHVFPTILIGLIMSRIKIRHGKKKMLLISGLIAGITLSMFGWTRNIYEVIGIVIGYSIFSAVSFNLLWATFEDFVSRESKFENDLIGLEQSASSLAYIIGPMVAGGLTEFAGEKMTIAYAGMGLVFTAILIISLIPKKIKMPHKELERIS